MQPLSPLFHTINASSALSQGKIRETMLDSMKKALQWCLNARTPSQKSAAVAPMPPTAVDRVSRVRPSALAPGAGNFHKHALLLGTVSEDSTSVSEQLSPSPPQSDMPTLASVDPWNSKARAASTGTNGKAGLASIRAMTRHKSIIREVLDGHELDHDDGAGADVDGGDSACGSAPDTLGSDSPKLLNASQPNASWAGSGFLQRVDPAAAGSASHHDGKLRKPSIAELRTLRVHRKTSAAFAASKSLTETAGLSRSSSTSSASLRP